jgi:hypothetical protein
MRTAAWIVMMLLGAASARAQVAPERQDAGRRLLTSVYGLGFSAGLASGIGLSFRHHLPLEFSYQVIGGIIKTDTKLHYNIGVELQYDAMRGVESRFFAVGALGYFYSGDAGRNDLRGPMRMGAGVGGEWNNRTPFHIGAELLFTYFSDGVILPLPQICGHYYFF